MTTFSAARRAFAIICFSASLAFATDKAAHSAKPAAKPQPACPLQDLRLDPANDIHATEEYQAWVQELVAHEQFDELDCLARSARINKTILPGGLWKLHTIYYGGVDAPHGHATERDWADHINRLQHWVDAYPQSIDARVALADGLISYAWDARGDGNSDSVTENGWALFQERIKRAHHVLDEAAKLPEKSPEWYMAMQIIARAEDWDPEREGRLLKDAVAFEPRYYYFARQHVEYLKPQWNGEPGDSERFIGEIADQIGGDAGDILYFQLASNLICKCRGEAHEKLLSWPRIQKGFVALEKQSGASILNTNLYAFMAIRVADSITADAMLKRIPDNQWDEKTWGNKRYFDECKTWADGRASYDREQKARLDAASANMSSSYGPAFKKELEAAIMPHWQECLPKAQGDLQPFAIIAQIDAQGRAGLGTLSRKSNLGLCLYRFLPTQYSTKPPHADYFLMLDLDPATVQATGK